MTSTPHEDSRVRFRLTIKDQNAAIVDISSATTREIRFKQPDGVSVQKDAVLTTDGTDGKMEYEAEEFFLTPGVWRYQGRIIISGKEFTGGDVNGIPLTTSVAPKL